MPISLENLNEFNLILRQEDVGRWVKAANGLLAEIGQDYRFPSRSNEKAKQFVTESFYSFLNGEEYLSAAALAFGFNYFDCRSQFSKDIFRVLRDYAKISIMGGSSCSKSYSAGIWSILDYVRDSSFTKIKVASMKKEHLQNNLFAHMCNVVQSSVIDLELDVNPLKLRIIKKNSKYPGSLIYGESFPSDPNVTGRFKGFKPDRRDTKHPLWDIQGRARILIDEASQVVEGVFGDLGSPEGSISGKDIVKIILCFNPDAPQHPTCDPYGIPPLGIESLDPEKDYEWTSKEGYHVLRLDGKNSENVVAGKEVIRGILTAEAFAGYCAGGESTIKYWVNGRGFWPIKGVIGTVIPAEFLQRSRGDYTFQSEVYSFASADLGYVTDGFILIVGRYGLAGALLDRGRARTQFVKDGVPYMKVGMQIDAIYEMPLSNDSVTMADAIMEKCKIHKVKPEWVALDATSYGTGVRDILRSKFGDVLGINWQEGSTELPIMQDDLDKPNNKYANIGTEMWFATKTWLEHGVIKFSNDLSAGLEKLFSQISSRREKMGGKLRRQMIESKPEFKKRSANRESSDYADSLVMAVQLCRTRAPFLPSISGVAENAGVGSYETNLSDSLVEEIDCLSMGEYEKRTEAPWGD